MEMSLEEHIAHVDKEILDLRQGIKDLQIHFIEIDQEDPEHLYNASEPEFPISQGS